MRSNIGSIVIPIAIITVGVGWLLTAQGYGEDIDWVWTLGLAVVGILTLVLSGIDKLSVVVGPFFLIASVFSLLRQTEQLDIELEIPLLIIIVGVLMLIAALPVIPAPAWVQASATQAKQKKGD